MYESYLNTIDERSEAVCALSDFLWEHPETSFKEVESSKAIEDFLEKRGL